MHCIVVSRLVPNIGNPLQEPKSAKPAKLAKPKAAKLEAWHCIGHTLFFGSWWPHILQGPRSRALLNKLEIHFRSQYPRSQRLPHLRRGAAAFEA